MPPTHAPAHDQETELAIQQAQIDVLSTKLNNAERAVAQARTPAAADDAHRRADALLLELEAAEDTLRFLEQTTTRSATTAPPKELAPSCEQRHLFITR
jgi:hypothetical protein